MNRLKSFVLLCLLAVTSINVHARSVAKPGEMPPKALLIELFSKKQTHDAMIALGSTKWIKDFERDVVTIQQLTIQDFTENFHGCPIYFFMDTNADSILKGSYTGVLLDKNMKVVQDLPFGNGDTSLYVGYFGEPMPQPETHENPLTTNTLGPNQEHIGDDPTSLRRTFIVMDTKFKVLLEPLPRTYKSRYYVPAFLLSQAEKKFVFSSQHFDMEYRNVGTYYNKTFQRYFAPVRYAFH